MEAPLRLAAPLVRRALPAQPARTVSVGGFEATRSLGALATAAPGDVQRGVPLCPADQVSDKPCLDTLAVSFIDPVNPYSLSDRAIKYGLLFVVLTFTGCGAGGGHGRGRRAACAPIQYALVGLALCLFFLLLLSLSEHLSFALAYGLASAYWDAAIIAQRTSAPAASGDSCLKVGPRRLRVGG